MLHRLVGLMTDVALVMLRADVVKTTWVGDWYCIDCMGNVALIVWKTDVAPTTWVDD